MKQHECPINERLLKQDVMEAARDALVAECKWYIHCSPIASFESIKRSGVVKADPGGESPPSIKVFGREVVCLRPIGSEDSTPRRGEALFKVAISAASLPSIVTLDWSFPGCWELACVLERGAERKSDEQIFCAVVKRRGSIMAYNSISVESLRVFTKGCVEDDPSAWPFIQSVHPSEIQAF